MRTLVRKVFYSFHYAVDHWRASQVRNIGKVEANVPLSDNDWEKLTRRGDLSIKKWIWSQMFGRSCAIVLIGPRSAGRKWIEYEIEWAWKTKKGLLGIYIHRLKNTSGLQARRGNNPFAAFSVNGRKLSMIVKTYDPPFLSSKFAYNCIKENLEDWVDEAIAIRGRF